jgi:hypothetical protein
LIKIKEGNETRHFRVSAPSRAGRPERASCPVVSGVIPGLAPG